MIRSTFPASDRRFKHGESSHNSALTPEYRAYVAARIRCNCATSKDYPYYGGRGITFRFNDYQHFLQSVGRRPSPQHSLDRINVNGDYEPGNIRWATRREQAQNRRPYQAISVVARSNAAKTECKRGHPLSGDNLQIDKRGCRQCKRCTRERLAAWRARACA